MAKKCTFRGADEGSRKNNRHQTLKDPQNTSSSKTTHSIAQLFLFTHTHLHLVPRRFSRAGQANSMFETILFSQPFGRRRSRTSNQREDAMATDMATGRCERKNLRPCNVGSNMPAVCFLAISSRRLGLSLGWFAKNMPLEGFQIPPWQALQWRAPFGSCSVLTSFDRGNFTFRWLPLF